MWKEAQQEVRQHWFIDSYIAAYMYTGAVQGYWSTPNWSDRRQGCRPRGGAASLLCCEIHGLYCRGNPDISTAPLPM
jgi:hypothetical protein